MNLKLRYLTLAICAMLSASGYAEETYNFELGVGYGSQKKDDGTKITSLIPGIAYYFTPIKSNDSEPFDELAFLQRSSDLTLVYTNMTYETTNFNKATLNPFLVSGTFYIKDFAFELSNNSFSNTNLVSKTDSTKYIGIKNNDTSIKLGYFIFPKSLLSYEYSDGKATYTPSSSLGTTINPQKTTKNSIISHSVVGLENSSSVAFDLNYSQIKQVQDKTEKNNEYVFAIKFYPQSTFFIEGGYKINTGDSLSDKGKTFSIGAGYAFNHNLHFQISNDSFTVDDSTQQSSAKSTKVGMLYRF